MRVVFMGTPDFAVPSLRALLDSPYAPCAVFTQPDRPSGRGQKIQPAPVKLLARSAGIPIYQPLRIRDDEHRAFFNDPRPDFVVVVAYGQILPGWLLNSARIAPVNVHGSLLPKYRGAAPVIWSIRHGDRRSGITTMLMDEHLDTGPILLQREVSIPPDMTGGGLSAVLAQVGAELLIPTLDGLRDGTVVPVPQDESQASLAPRIRKEMGRIRWESPAESIHNLIRAFHPWPLAYGHYRGQRLAILRSVPRSGPGGAGSCPGTYLGRTDEGLRVLCGEETILEILAVQPANRGPVSGREFANGARLKEGELLFPVESGP